MSLLWDYLESFISYMVIKLQEAIRTCIVAQISLVTEPIFLEHPKEHRKSMEPNCWDQLMDP